MKTVITKSVGTAVMRGHLCLPSMGMTAELCGDRSIGCRSIWYIRNRMKVRSGCETDGFFKIKRACITFGEAGNHGDNSRTEKKGRVYP